MTGEHCVGDGRGSRTFCALLLDICTQLSYYLSGYCHILPTSLPQPLLSIPFSRRFILEYPGQQLPSESSGAERGVGGAG